MFKGDAYKQHWLVFSQQFHSFPLSQVEVVKRPPGWVVSVDVFPQLFGEDHPQLDLQVGSILQLTPFLQAMTRTIFGRGPTTTLFP